LNAFALHLQDATQYERIEGVTRFVGEDGSGQFGLLARHERFMTVLGVGLCRYRQGEAPWTFLAVPGGLLYFVDGELFLCTTHYLRDSERDRLAVALDAELRQERAALGEFRVSLRRLEEEMLRRLWRYPGGRTP
jgi:F-type H+-transporting ATPase subunit epsilon